MNLANEIFNHHSWAPQGFYPCGCEDQLDHNRKHSNCHKACPVPWDECTINCQKFAAPSPQFRFKEPVLLRSGGGVLYIAQTCSSAVGTMYYLARPNRHGLLDCTSAEETFITSLILKQEIL